MLRFDYPAHNRYSTPLEYVRRQIVVSRVRDLAVEPLDPEDLELRPLVRRGSLLITGIDQDLGQERSFYLEAMRRISLDGQRLFDFELPAFRLGLYDPGSRDESPDYVGPIYQPSPFDQIAMQAAAAKFREWKESRPDLPYVLAAFPVRDSA